MNKIIPVLLSIIIFITFEAIILIHYNIQYKLICEKERFEVLGILSDVRGQLEFHSNSTFLLVNGLITYVSTHPDLTNAEFETFARSLIRSDKLIKNVTLAPDNVIRFVYPLKGNEPALGLDLASNEEQKETVFRMIESGKTVIAGPVNLVQGGVAFINRTPIFVTDKNGEKLYWGMASVPIRMHGLFEESGLYEIPGNLEIGIRGKDGLGEKGDIILGDMELFKQDSVILSVSLPNGSWQIACIPENGWGEKKPVWIIILGTILSLILSLLILVVLYGRRRLHELNIKLNDYIKLIDKYIITSSTDLEGNITYASEAFTQVCGYSKQELLGKKHNIVRHKSMPDSLYKDLWNTIKSGKEWHGEMMNKRKDNTQYWVDIKISPIYKNNKMIGYTSIRQNISDKKKLEQLSIKDELTGLFNRRYFNEMFPKEMRRAKRDGIFFSFFIMDVDHFKQYNDNYGHQEGDRVLNTIGKLLIRNSRRASDYAFRLGGEEFGMVFSGMNKDESFTFVDNIRSSVEKLKIEHIKNTALQYVTISGGLVTISGKEFTDFDLIYKEADLMLYKAKNSGRNMVLMSSLTSA